MNEDKNEKLGRRRKAYASALATIEKAMVDVFEASAVLRDSPFIDDARKDLEKVGERLREAQKKLIVALYDTDKEIGAETAR